MTLNSSVDLIVYNMQRALPRKVTDENTLRLARLQADYLAFNEINTDEKGIRLEENVRAYGYQVINHLDIPGGNKTPLCYATSFKRMLDFGSLFLCDELGEEGAGPATHVPKRANWGLFRDRSTGNKELVINMHLPPSVQVPARSKLHKQAIRNVTDFALDLRDEWEAKVFIVGDVNVNYGIKGRWRFRRLLNNGFTTNWEHFPEAPASFPKHNSKIDWSISNQVPRNQEVLMDYQSDHRPVRVWY